MRMSERESELAPLSVCFDIFPCNLKSRFNKHLV